MIDETKIRDSFKKIREEMDFLENEVSVLKTKLDQIYEFLKQSKGFNAKSMVPQQQIKLPADNINYNEELSFNFQSSIGNDGVPADSQQTVNRQPTDIKRTYTSDYNKPISTKEEQEITTISSVVDTLKKDLQYKFKSLTKQEFLIFSLLYTLTEELDQVSYKDLAIRSKLTESSIRDYITRLEHKGIPIIKEKINNRRVILSIPRELKDISTLDTLAKLKRY